MSAKATAVTSTSRYAARTAAPVFADDDEPLGMSPMFRSFIAGQLATLRELTLFYAPNINSYKRFVDGSFAPTAIAWGHGQSHLRAAGGRTRPRDADGVPGAGRRRQPVPGGGRADRRRPARHRPGAGAAGRLRRATRTPAVRNASRPRWPRPPSCSTHRRWRVRRSATRSSNTTSTTPASSWPRSTPPSPTGKGCVALNASDGL